MLRTFINYSVIVVIISFFNACKKNESIDPCILNPTVNNASLNRIIALENKHNFDSSSINLVSRHKKTNIKEYFFVVTNGSPILQYHFLPNAQIYNCDGVDIAEYFQKSDYDAFFSSVKFEKKIWKKNKNNSIENRGTCNTLNPITDLPYFADLDKKLNQFAWKSIIYQYSYKGKTLYYGIFTRKELSGTKSANLAAMDCEGHNLQDDPTWSQSDFLQNAVLERQIR